MWDNDIFASGDEHEENNVPNYDLFNKYVFHIYQQAETIEFAYSIDVSNWVILDHQYPTIDDPFKWRKKCFQNEYLEKPLKILMKTMFLIVTKKEEEILMTIIRLFIMPKKLKIDKFDECICEKKLDDDDIDVVKVIPSLVIGTNHSKVRCSLGKGYDKDHATCSCSVPHCKSGSLACTFNSYPPALRKPIISTGKKVNNNPETFPIGN